MKILDVGCGMRKYRSNNIKDKVIGVDIDRKTQADIIHNLNKYPWPFKTNEFDMIFSSHCIEHLDNWIKVLREMIRITKPGGTIEILTPHFSSAVAYATVGHINYFAVSTFTMSLPNFIKELKLEKIELRYLLTTDRYKNFFEELAHKILTELANSNQHLCERVWCYWFGGFNEIYVRFKVVK